MWKRVAVGGLVLAGVVLGSTPAPAAPSPRVTVTLSCSRGAEATAAVEFVEAPSGSVPKIDCGGTFGNRNSVRVDLPAGVDHVVVSTFAVTAVGDCGTPDVLALPVRLSCPIDGRDARLVVR